MVCCCGPSKAQRAQMTNVEKTSASFRCALNWLAVFVSLAVVFFTLGGAFLLAVAFLCVWGPLLGVAFRAQKTKNEKLLRAFVGVSMCVLCCGMVFGVGLMAAGGHHDGRMVQFGSPDTAPQDLRDPNQKPLMQLNDPNAPKALHTDKPMMAMHDPKTLKPLAEPAKSEPAKSEKPTDQNEGEGDNQDGNDDGDDEGHARGGIILGLFFVMLGWMTFLSFHVASIMLAARLIRFLRLERLSAHAMMAPGSTGDGDIALQPMPSSGAPQVFYMPTADGQPQYVVYQPVGEV